MNYLQSKNLLQSDRAAFIAACPKLGIAKSVAQAAFGSPRHIDACLWIHDQWSLQWKRDDYRGHREPVMVIAAMSEERWPVERGA